MKEIRKYLYNLIENDPIIRGYTGYLISDPRIYLVWPPENIQLVVATPAKIAVNYTEPGGVLSGEYVEGAQYPDGFFSVNVWATTPDLRDDIVERIEDIFKLENYSDLYFSTVNYRVLGVKRVGKDNTTEIHPSTQKIEAYRTYLQFEIRGIFRL